VAKVFWQIQPEVILRRDCCSFSVAIGEKFLDFSPELFSVSSGEGFMKKNCPECSSAAAGEIF
jgi:hypothetical protein